MGPKEEEIKLMKTRRDIGDVVTYVNSIFLDAIEK